MKKLIVIILFIIFSPLIVFAFRDGEPDGFSKNLVAAAIERTTRQVTYDGRYHTISYPNGDVPDHTGVCTDVVIRSYRKLGIDLQKDIFEDMNSNFSEYPDHWGLTRPDKNIDHRRVPNLQTLFKRKGIVLGMTPNASDYVPGDLVTWMLPGNLPHIGIIIDKKSADNKRPLVVHNIGRGPKIDDMLFAYPVTGHYRYYGNLLN